jgi:hypothetical protein
MSADTRPAPYLEPSEPGFYWRRTMSCDRGGPGWRWTVVEVYRMHGDPPDGPLMTNGYEVAGCGVEWGPRCEPPTEPSGVTPGGEP